MKHKKPLASTSSVGFNRATRLMEELEEAGIGPAEKVPNHMGLMTQE